MTFRKVGFGVVSSLLFFSLCFFGCAQIGPLTGGEEDIWPPKLDTLLSTRNYQTRFEKKTIVLAFDEWVELRDAFSQVIVSPPLEFRPEVVRRKKTVQFNFHEDEILRDSATYVINFGEAIRDITEGNVAPITFVFSTGDYIDSLSVSGQVVDAFTNAPVQDVLFLLYENLADSVFRTERPFYFGRTDEDGNFEVRNMKSGTFKATALVDANLNYLFDSEVEKVGFLDEPIEVKGMEKAPIDSMQNDSLNIFLDSLQIDTIGFDTLKVDSLERTESPSTDHQAPIALRLFEPEKRLFLINDEQEKYGQIKLVFNRETLGEETVKFDEVGQSVFLENDKDTVRVWYSIAEDAEWNVYVKADTIWDTIAVEPDLRDDFFEEEKLRPAGKNGNSPSVQVPKQPFSIEFNHPLSSFDTSLIRVYADTLRVPVRAKINIDSVNVRQLIFDNDWQPKLEYEFEVPPGALTDIYGLSLADTVRRSLTGGAPEDFSTLTFRVKNLRPDTAYVIRLLDKNENEYRAFRVVDSSQFEVRLSLVPPGVYSVELIEDLDRNGKWTTGNYDLKRQPERVRRRTIEELRANWEVDAEVEWTDKISNPVQTDESSSGGAPETPGPDGIRTNRERGNR